MPGDLELAIRIRADLDRAVRDLKKLDRSIARTGTETDKAARRTRGLSNAWDRASRGAAGLRRRLGGLQGALAALGIAVLTRQVIQAGVALERLESRFRAATGSAQAASQELAFVRVEAERLGIDFVAAADAFSGFAAAAKGTALEGQQAREIFTAVAEAARVMGLSADNTRGALLALEQIVSKGVVSAEELRGQLGERLPGAFQIAARAMGVTTRELGKMLQRGEVLAEDLLPKLAKELRASVAEGLPEAVDTAEAAFRRLDNSLFDLKTSIAESGLLDFFADLAKGVTSALRAISGAADEAQAATLTSTERALVEARRHLARGESRPRSGHGSVSYGDLAKRRADVVRLEIEVIGQEVALRKRQREVEDDIAELEVLVASGGRASVGKRGRLLALREELAEIKADLDVTERRALAVAEIFERSSDPGTPTTEDTPTTTDPGQKAIAALERELALRGDIARVQRVQFEIEQGSLQNITEAEQERILALARKLDLQEESERLLKREIAAEKEAAEKAKKAAEERADANREAMRQIEAAGHALLDPYAQARIEIDRWVEATRASLDEAGLAYEEYSAWIESIAAERRERVEEAEDEHQKRLAEQRLQESKHWRDGFTRALKGLEETYGDTASLVEAATYRAFSSMEDALVDFVQTGKLNFSSLAESIIADLARIAIRQAITGPLAQGLLGALGGGTTGGTGGYTGVNYGVFHGGGVAGQLGGTRRTGIPAHAWRGAPRFHSGGIAGFRPDEVPILARRGEGVFTPEQMHALGSAHTPEVHINFENRGTPQREVDRETRFDGKRWVISIVTDDIERGGSIARATRQLGMVT